MKEKIFHGLTIIIIAFLFYISIQFIVNKYYKEVDKIDNQQSKYVLKIDSVNKVNNKFDSLIKIKEYEINKTQTDFNLSNKSVNDLSKLLQKHSK